MIRPRTSRVAAGLMLSLAVLAGSAGCSAATENSPAPAASASPRPLSDEEAQRLSTMRFLNYSAGVREVSLSVDDGGTTYDIAGYVDFTAALGYATVSAGNETSLLAWSSSVISSHEATGDGLPPVPPPGLDGGGLAWTTSDLVPADSRLHAALAVLLEAGHDRPDNPLLLRQTDARWLRADTIDGTAVDVVAGPTSDEAYDPSVSGPADGSGALVRYWVDADARLLRIEARLGGGSEWTQIELGDEAEVEFADAFLSSGGDG